MDLRPEPLVVSTFWGFDYIRPQAFKNRESCVGFIFSHAFVFWAAVFESCKVHCSAMTSHHFRVCVGARVCACPGADRFYVSVHSLFVLSLKSMDADADSYNVKERILKQCRIPWQLNIVEVS